MKFFKFNLTPMGVILHTVTILINFRCCHGNLLLMNVSRNRKVKKLAYLPGYWLDLAQIGCIGVFSDSKSKINNKIFIRRHPDVKMT